jgi:hypothetical protein
MRNICIVEACEAFVFGHGYCNAHYKRWRKSGDPGEAESRRQPGRVCSVEGCEKAYRASGFCSSHHRRWKDSGVVPETPIALKRFRGIKGVCSRPGCEKLTQGSGYCPRHYGRLRLMQSYGLTGFDEFDALWRRCKGECEICGRPLEQDDRNTAIDHDHKTLQARGILCSSCNTGIGGLQDSIDMLKNAIKYLERATGFMSAVDKGTTLN